MTKPEIVRRLRDHLTLMRQLLPAVQHMGTSSLDVGEDVVALEDGLRAAEAHLADIIDQMMANKYHAHNHRTAVANGTVRPRGQRLVLPLAPRTSAVNFDSPVREVDR